MKEEELNKYYEKLFNSEEFKSRGMWNLNYFTKDAYIANGKVTVRCECGCTIVAVEKETLQNEVTYTLSAYESSFYARQGKIKQYLKRLFYALIGKDFNLYEIILDGKDYRKLMF